MARSAILISALMAMAALVSAAPYHREYHSDHDIGLVNANPGHHLIIDDIAVKDSLNDLVDINILTAKDVLNNVNILSHNG